MGYYDGNTVTALWNYAQHYALNDNSFGTTFGPSTPGAINLVSGNTHGTPSPTAPDEIANGTIIGDPDPAYDDCSGTDTANMTGTNVGELLNRHNVTWGWFQGGFKPTSRVGRQGGLRLVARERRRRHGGGLQPPPRAVPVLQGDGEPAPSAAVVRGDDRPHRSGQAPVRPERLLGRRPTTATCPLSASSSPRSTRTAMPTTPIRSTSSTSSSTRSTGCERLPALALDRDRDRLRRL